MVYPTLEEYRERRGGQSEYQFYAAMQADHPPNPYWFYGVERGTEEQDDRGIDAIARLDVGEVPIQIKTSYRGLEKFRKFRHTPNVNIIVIVVGDLSRPAIKERTLEYLFRERGKILRKKRNNQKHRRR